MNNKNLGEMDTLTQKCAALPEGSEELSSENENRTCYNWLYFLKSVRCVPSQCKTASMKAPWLNLPQLPTKYHRVEDIVFISRNEGSCVCPVHSYLHAINHAVPYTWNVLPTNQLMSKSYQSLKVQPK